MALLTPGTLFAGKYRINEVLGKGGFATVFHAFFEEINRPVAIKVLTPSNDGTYSDVLTQRFLREARLISELSSKHTVTLYDFGREEDLLYMVFEFVHGRGLDDLIQQGPLAPQTAVRFVTEILDSLGEAHQCGILHRDIKPANIIAESTSTGDTIKVLDFGIAKAFPGSGRDHTKTLTREGTFIGTPRYVAPEQIMLQDLTPAADIYSVGLVAFEMLTGIPAIDGLTDPQVIKAQLDNKAIIWPKNSKIDPALVQIVAKMIRKDPATRFQTTDEARQALLGWRPGADATETKTQEYHAPKATPTNASPWGFAAGMVGVLCLAAAVFVLTNQDPVTAPEPEPPSLVEVSFDDPNLVLSYIATYGPPRQFVDVSAPAKIPVERRAVVRVRSKNLNPELVYIADVDLPTGARRTTARRATHSEFSILLATQRSGERVGREIEFQTTKVHGKVEDRDNRAVDLGDLADLLDAPMGESPSKPITIEAALKDARQEAGNAGQKPVNVWGDYGNIRPRPMQFDETPQSKTGSKTSKSQTLKLK